MPLFERPRGEAGAGGRRGEAGELAEVANEVRLVVVAEAGGEVGPAAGAAAAEVVDDPIKADQAGEAFRGEADLGVEMVDEGLLAAAELGGEAGDVDAADLGLCYCGGCSAINE